MKKLLSAIALAVALAQTSGCAFFEEPLDDLGSIVPSSAAGTDDPASLPAPDTLPPPLPSVPVQDGSAQNGSAKTSSPARAISATADGTYLLAATLFDIPDDVENITFVHFTKRSTRREMAVCRALMERYQVTQKNTLPANASNVIVWPLTDDTGSDCDSLLKGYEGIDISVETARKVTADAAGPFMLSRNAATDQRMIFDLSKVSPRAMTGALDQWKAVTSSAAANWPDYQSVE